ncbi:hypothetical protein C3943_13170 [Lysinibacillus sp. B2A1]|nr:hypothetical protein C3943_13170 [Lysinibacillus sp. B2A1]
MSKTLPLIEMSVPASTTNASAQIILNAGVNADYGLEIRKNNQIAVHINSQKHVAFLGHDDAWFTIQDLKQSASDVKTNVAAAITDKGVPTSPTATGTQMAANIRAIPTGGRKANGLLISSSTLASFNYKGGGIVSMAYIDLTGLNFTPSIIVLMTSTGNGNMSYSIFTSFNDPTGFTSSTKISLYNSNLFSNSPNHNLSHIAISGGYRFPVTSQSASYTWYAYE